VTEKKENIQVLLLCVIYLASDVYTISSVVRDNRC